MIQRLTLLLLLFFEVLSAADSGTPARVLIDATEAAPLVEQASFYGTPLFGEPTPLLTEEWIASERIDLILTDQPEVTARLSPAYRMGILRFALEEGEKRGPGAMQQER